MKKEQKTEKATEDIIVSAKVVGGEILTFSGVGEKDVYNPAPLKLEDGSVILAGRVESRKNALDSKVMFFHEVADGAWMPIKDSPVFYELEDPFITKIGDEIIFGGVHVDWDISEDSNNPKLVSFKTIFYRGKDINNLKQFSEGPERMKDIRLVELADGRIGIFSRPQGGKAGKGKIGFTTVDSLDDVTPDVIQSAPLLKDNFTGEDWGGANAIYLLQDGRLGVLGHVASKDEKNYLHYRAMAFIYDPKTGESSDIKIVAVRDDFPETKPKEERLRDVVFTAGLVYDDKKEPTLYVGLSDAFVGRITVEDPFLI